MHTSVAAIWYSWQSGLPRVFVPHSAYLSCKSSVQISVLARAAHISLSFVILREATHMMCARYTYYNNM